MKRICLMAVSLTGLWGCTIVVPQPLVPRPTTAATTLPGEPPRPQQTPGMTQPGTGTPGAPPSNRPGTSLPPGQPIIGSGTGPGSMTPGPLPTGTGGGEPGTPPAPVEAQVALDYIESLAIDSKGALYIMAAYDGQIWRRNADGTLTRVAGNVDLAGGDSERQLDGAVATDVALDNPQDIAVDAQDRLLILSNNHVLRLEPDGRLKSLGEGWGRSGGYLLPVEGDEVLLMATYTWDNQGTLVSFAPGRSPKELVSVPFGSDTNLWGCGITADGRILGKLHASRMDPSMQAGQEGIVAIDRATGELTAMADVAKDAVLDRRGNLFTRTEADGLTVTAGGETTQLAIGRPDGDTLAWDPAKQTIYASRHFQVQAVDANGRRDIAGIPERGAFRKPAEGFHMARPGGLVAKPDGTLLFGDIRINRLFELDAAGQTVTGPEAYTGIQEPAVLRLDRQGRLWTLRSYGDGLRCLDEGVPSPQGVPREVVDFAFLANGDMLVSARPMSENGRHMQVLRVGQGEPEVILDEPENPHGGYSACFGLAATPDGQAWILGRDRAFRWSPANGLGEPTALSGFPALGGEGGGGTAVAPDGRVFVAGQSGVSRFDPASSSLIPVALPEAPRSVSGLAFTASGQLAYLDGLRRRLVLVPPGQY